MKIKSFITGSAYIFLMRILSAVAWLIVTILVSRYGDADGIGVLLFFYSSSTLLGGMFTGGLGSASIKYISRYLASGERNNANRLAWMNVRLSWLYITPLLFLALVDSQTHILGHIFVFPGFLQFAPLLMLWVAATALRSNAYDGLIGLGETYRAGVFSGFGASMLTLAIIVVCVLTGQQIDTALILFASVLPAIFSALFAQLTMLRVANRDSKEAHDTPVVSYRRLAADGIPVSVSSTLSSRRKEIIVVILAYLASVHEVALLGISNQIMQLLAMPMMAVAVIIQPAIARAIKSPDFASGVAEVRFLWSLSLIPIVIIAVFCIAFSELLVGAAYGDEFVAVGNLVIVAVIGRILSVVSGPTSQFIAMSDKPNVLAYMSVIEVSILSVSAYFLCKYFGAVGGSWAYTISVAISSLMQLCFIKKNFGVWVFIRFRRNAKPFNASSDVS